MTIERGLDKRVDFSETAEEAHSGLGRARVEAAGLGGG